MKKPQEAPIKIELPEPQPDDYCVCPMGDVFGLEQVKDRLDYYHDISSAVH